jgi:hypothetical protein
MSTFPEQISIEELQKNSSLAENYIEQLYQELQQTGFLSWLAKEYDKNSQSDDSSYPGQGLYRTDYDGSEFATATVEKLNQEIIDKTIYAWLYYLELFNHPERLKALFETTAQEFHPPQAKRLNPIFLFAKLLRQAIAINELALHPTGAEKERTKRTERFTQNTFVKIGKQARIPLVGSANPEIWGSPSAIASMAMSHGLVGIPRDGVFSNLDRQAALVKKVHEWLENSPTLLHKPMELQQQLLNSWKHNLMGVIEAEPQKALARATSLYLSGVRTFRIYSPEPGDGPLKTLVRLQQQARDFNWEPIEVFAGQVVSVEQALALQAAGADGIYIGIGGGGRCTTGVRSGAAIDWPQLVWELRGKLRIPILVEGGASDNIAVSMATGVTGIGVTRAVGGGTLESPGGWNYLKNELGKLFKLYGGEASARMRAMAGRIGPFGIIQYVEGETTTAEMNYGRGNLPTLMQNIHLLLGDVVMGMVFQNAENIADLQEKGAHNLRKVSAAERDLRRTH